jgi:hypothetical protein
MSLLPVDSRVAAVAQLLSRSDMCNRNCYSMCNRYCYNVCNKATCTQFPLDKTSFRSYSKGSNTLVLVVPGVLAAWAAPVVVPVAQAEAQVAPVVVPVVQAEVWVVEVVEVAQGVVQVVTVVEERRWWR